MPFSPKSRKIKKLEKITDIFHYFSQCAKHTLAPRRHPTSTHREEPKNPNKSRWKSLFFMIVFPWMALRGSWCLYFSQKSIQWMQYQCWHNSIDCVLSFVSTRYPWVGYQTELIRNEICDFNEWLFILVLFDYILF